MLSIRSRTLKVIAILNMLLLNVLVDLPHYVQSRAEASTMFVPDYNKAIDAMLQESRRISQGLRDGTISTAAATAALTRLRLQMPLYIPTFPDFSQVTTSIAHRYNDLLAINRNLSDIGARLGRGGSASVTAIGTMAAAILAAIAIGMSVDLNVNLHIIDSNGGELTIEEAEAWGSWGGYFNSVCQFYGVCSTGVNCAD